MTARSTHLEPWPGWRLVHAPRQIQPAGSLECRGWRLKLYGIRGRSRPVPAQLIEAAGKLAADYLPSPALTEDRYGVGFAICHDARDFDTVTLDWWERTNELRHLVFRSLGDSGSFTNITHSGEAACVWELAIIGFEREAWIDAVLKAERKNLDEYLSRSMAGFC